MKYYPIDEDAARRAKNANSLSDYAEGSATSEYRREVNRAATLAEECKKGKTDAQQEKIDYLLDRYARRLADNMNASNRNRASCPSVMVAGWSNFPVRKKQQQLSRDDTLMREWRDYSGHPRPDSSCGSRRHQRHGCRCTGACTGKTHRARGHAGKDEIHKCVLAQARDARRLSGAFR